MKTGKKRKPSLLPEIAEKCSRKIISPAINLDLFCTPLIASRLAAKSALSSESIVRAPKKMEAEQEGTGQDENIRQIENTGL